jgi:hypothetical protein
MDLNDAEFFSRKHWDFDDEEQMKERDYWLTLPRFRNGEKPTIDFPNVEIETAGKIQMSEVHHKSLVQLDYLEREKGGGFTQQVAIFAITRIGDGFISKQSVARLPKEDLQQMIKWCNAALKLNKKDVHNANSN